jgi:glucose/arabinose dehydrogenase
MPIARHLGVRRPARRSGGQSATARAIAWIAALALAPGAPAQELRLETVVEGLADPVYLTHAGDARLFVVEQPGRILVLEGGELRAEPFLDISSRVLIGDERGLLSVAFHPDYDANGFLFVNYTRRPDGATVVSRFRRDGADPDRVDDSSEAVLFVVPQPFPNHNGGQLQFGPDGMLWIGMGDGGNAFDPLCNAQRRDTLLGKLLRVDVDHGSGSPPFYRVPSDNPFVGAGGFEDEVWAVGLRNPWRFSFDRETGDLYIGDVGQRRIEEIDFEPAGDPGGHNYGWRKMEGSACANVASGCPGYAPDCGDPVLVLPVLEYEHDAGNCSVTGGYVYRGTQIPELRGSYLYGDFCSGRLFAAVRSDGVWQARALDPRLRALSSFGEDAAGELYLLSLEGGRVARLSTQAAEPEPEPFVCEEGPATLCLAGGRFRVSATWRSTAGAGAASVVPLTGDTGALWFFDDSNIEVLVKVLDGRAVNGNFWVFAAGLTDVEVSLEVADAATGARRAYTSSLGEPFRTIADTTAFAGVP